MDHRRRRTERVVRPVMQVLYWFLPRGPHVVVHGWPRTDGNAVEIVRALVRRFSGPVVWLDGPPRRELRERGFDAGSRLSTPRMNSLSGALAFLTARATFFTHGIFWSVRPPRRKPLIDLWHGDGPKSHSGASIASTFEVSGSREFGTYRCAFHGVPVANLLLTGNPRITQLRVPATHEQLAFLGLPPSDPFVVWMPTYRRSLPTADSPGWKDFLDEDPTDELQRETMALARALQQHGVQLVVKLHPLDASDLRGDDILTLSDDRLAEAGTNAYAVLGASAALVTDYSSIWTDYLALDRPMGFLIPDHERYGAVRGLHPEDVMDHLPGVVLSTEQDRQRFATEVATGTPATADLRRRAVDRFGLVHPESPADELLDALAHRRVLTGIAM